MARKKSGVLPETHTKPLTIAAHLPETPELLQPHVDAMVTALAGDKNFTPLAVPIAKTKTDNGALATALPAAKNGGPVERAAVVAADETVRQDVRELRPSIQGILRGMPPDQWAGILANILMSESHVGTRKPKPPLAMNKTSPSGSAILDALAILGALTYDWEVSSDGGTSWSVFGRTAKAQVTITGLTPGKSYCFRFNAFLRNETTTTYVQIGPLMVK